MKNLVYLACFLGENAEIYKKMLNTCVETLRTRGKFFGEIIVLKNVKETLLTETYRDYVLEVFVDVSKDYGFSANQKQKAKGKHFKLILHHFIDTTLYDSILFLDIDIIAVRNINALFDLKNQQLLYAIEDTPMSSDSFNHYISDYDLPKAASLKGANSGTFCVLGKDYEIFVEKWKQNINLKKERTGYEWDQPALNNLIFKKEIKALPYGLKTVYFPLLYSQNYSKETLLYHFNSKGKKDKDFNVMKSYLDLIF